jgi:hypothetical protein
MISLTSIGDKEQPSRSRRVDTYIGRCYKLDSFLVRGDSSIEEEESLIHVNTMSNEPQVHEGH